MARELDLALPVLVATVGFIAFLAFLIQAIHRLRKWSHAFGKVVAVVDVIQGGEKYLAPVVRFSTAQGENIRFTSEVCGTWCLYQLGQRVRVLYDPQNPARAEINSFVRMWLGALVSLLLTAFALAFLSASRFLH